MSLAWEHVRSFLAVVREGSLLGAARRLKLTQPTIGRHIDLLEDKIGAPLFTRGRDGMILTDKGLNLVTSAEAMGASAEDFERRATGLQETIAGPVRISANEIFGALLLPAILVPFMAEHPEIEIEVEISNAATNLTRRDADVAIRMFRPLRADLIARKIAELPLGLYAHSDYLERHGAPRSVPDLQEHVFIGFDRNAGLIDAAAAVGVRFAASDFQFRCDSILSHVSAIRSGLGIGVTHQGLAARWPGVVRVLSDLDLPALEMWLVCHSDVRTNRRIRLMMDYLAQALQTPYAHYSP